MCLLMEYELNKLRTKAESAHRWKLWDHKD